MMKKAGVNQRSGFFQSLENLRGVFPIVGTFQRRFSNRWKWATWGVLAALLAGPSCMTHGAGLAAGDVLELTVVCPEISPEPQRLELVVQASGLVTVPVLGEMPVVGMTQADVEAEIRRLAKENNILRDPQISVAIRRAATD